MTWPAWRRSESSPRRSRSSGDGMLDVAERLDLDPHDVARAQELPRVHRHADAARRAGQDEVPRLERAGLRDEVDELLRAEDEVARGGVLAQLAVDVGRDAQVARIRHLVGRR